MHRARVYCIKQRGLHLIMFQEDAGLKMFHGTELELHKLVLEILPRNKGK